MPHYARHLSRLKSPLLFALLMLAGADASAAGGGGAGLPWETPALQNLLASTDLAVLGTRHNRHCVCRPWSGFLRRWWHHA